MNPAEVLGTFNRVYGLSAAEITQVYGGTVGYTYTVEESFLKIYDKALSVTPRCTEFLGERLAALSYLQDDTPLRGRICYPLKTAAGRLFYEDGQSVYVAFNRIPGAAIGWNRELYPDELEQVAELAAALHQVEVRGPLCSVPREKFELGFCRELEALITGRELLRAPRRFLSLMRNYEAEIRERAGQAKSLARSLAERGLPFVLCHTDIHGGNLMKASSGKLYLIDWENMILAPKEADLFSFCEKPYFNLFTQRAAADGEALLYYLIRRDLEDIWEFLRTVLYDGTNEKERNEIFGHLVRISAHLSGLDK